ncbi:MAG: response regulator [Pseudomonadota bacterium]
MSCWRALLAALLLASAAAQATPERWDKLTTPLFSHLGLEQGMPHPIVMALAQDGAGFIWIGTQRGLARWDGYRMRNFFNDAADPASLPGDFVQALHADIQGRLWIGSANAGLAMYDRATEQFVRYPAGPQGLSSAAVSAIASAPDGAIWVGTAAGLDRIEPGRPGARHWRAEPSKAGSLRDGRIRSLLVDRKGNLWIGSATGLARRDARSGKITEVAVGEDLAWRDSVLAIAENGAGQIAFGTLKSGIGIIDPGAPRARLLKLGDVPDADANMVLAIAESAPGTWWATTYGGGVIEFNAAGTRARRIEHQAAVAASLASDRTAALLRDRSGLLWLGNERGVDFHDPANRAVATLFGGQGLLEAAVPALMSDSGGRVWLALADQGIDLVAPDGARSALLRPDPLHPDSALPNRMVLALAEAEPQEAWIGTQLGLYHSSAHGSAVRRVALAQANPHPRVGTVLVRRGALWLGTFDGLLQYDPASGALRNFGQGAGAAGGLSDNRIQAVLADGDKLWVGTRNGLNLLDPASGAVEQISANPADPQALADPVITSLALDGQGRLWVASQGGGIGILTGRDKAGVPRFRRLGVADGLPSTAVSTLKLDHQGRIWASTSDAGIAVIDPHSLRARALGRAEGLAFPTFYVGAIALTPEHDLLFGGTGGVAIVRPSLLGEWRFAAPLAITAVRLGARALAPAQLAGPDGLVLAPDVKQFEVELAVLDFSAPQRNRYAYRLDGYDQGWTETDAQRRVVSYSNLGPGRYNLRLRGANRDGAWGSGELTLAVRVLPAWHQTWWAMLGALLALAGAAYGTVRWRVRHLQRNRDVLQALVYSRTEHLEKLNAIVRTINEQPDFDALLHAILRESTFIRGIDAAYALVREQDSGELALRASWVRVGGAPQALRLSLEQAEQLYVEPAVPVAADIFVTRGAGMREVGAGARLAVRMRIGEQVEGFLVFENRQQALAFDADDLALLVALKEPFVSAFQKASSLRQIEQARANAEAATRAKSDFLANISHEIRTPMNAILGFAGLGTHLDLPHQPLDYFRKIGRAGNSLLAIVNDVLDFSKIESGKLELEVVPFDLSETLNQIADLFAWRAAEKELELVIWAAPELPVALLGDQLRLSQVLVNLLGNALKFTSHGHIELRVTADPAGPALEPDQLRLRFTVDDSGVGISADQRARLFQAFAQADASTTRLYGGTGLGLAISQQLVRKMGSLIEVDSTLGSGSRFSFSVVLRTVRAAGLQGLRAGQGAVGKHVLVVDDSLPTREMLEQQLRSFGFEARAVGSGAGALLELQVAHYDVVLMDWHMPGMDGIETARRIKAELTLTELPAIIMVTAFAREHIKQAAGLAGIDAFLVKPVTPAHLLESVLASLGFASGAPAATAASFPSAAAMAIAGARVLVVDDNAINQQVAAEILQRAGVHVELAGNGLDALRMVDQSAFDAVLMDIQMPDMDGYQATARIRERDQHAALPVIAMTAHAIAGYRENCLAMGMNDYVTKPVDPETLYAVLAIRIKPDALRRAAPQPVRPARGAAPAALPGIDMADAMERLGGNGALLLRLIALFAHDLGSGPAQIRAAVDEADFDAAALLAHKVKGAAGNLSAPALHRAADALESLLMARQREGLDAALGAFDNAFEQIIANVAATDIQ